MDKRRVFVLLVILAGTLIAAEGAPQNELVPEISEVEPPEAGTDPELFEAEVGTADGTIDPVDPPFLADVSTGLPTAQVPESDEVMNQPEAGAEVGPMENDSKPESEPAGADTRPELELMVAGVAPGSGPAEAGAGPGSEYAEAGPGPGSGYVEAGPGPRSELIEAGADPGSGHAEAGPGPESESMEAEAKSEPKEFEAGPGPMGSEVVLGTMPATAASRKARQTKILVEKIVYRWTIINYNHHDMEYGEALYSPVFSGENSEEYKWQLQFYPRGNNIKYKSFTSLYLASVGKNGATPSVQFSIIDKNGRNVNIKKFKAQRFSGQTWGFGNFVGYVVLEKGYHKIWVPDDRLTLVVEIIFSPGIKEATHCTDLSKTECLAMPYDNHYHNDVHLYLSDHQSVPAQKAILAGHSTWFAKKFQQNQYTNTIILPPNVTVDELRESVRFMHTAEVNPSMAQRLKALAEQLGMKKLKEFSEEVLCMAEYDALRGPENM